MPLDSLLEVKGNGRSILCDFKPLTEARNHLVVSAIADKVAVHKPIITEVFEQFAIGALYIKLVDAPHIEQFYICAGNVALLFCFRRLVRLDRI